MTDYQDITLEIDSRNVAWMTLNREGKHNAISSMMMKEITLACRELNTMAPVRAVVLTGAGQKSFSAGADLGWMRENFQCNREQRIAESALLADMLEALDTLDKITIARVNGQAYAGGIGLIAVCDIAISVDSARFALTETRLGLTPANISPYLIARLGVANARRILIHAHTFNAQEARQLGLVHRVVSNDELDQAVEEELTSCLACAPGAMAMTKRLIANVSRYSHEENKSYVARMLADAWETEEAQAGVSGFFNKQPPPWAG